VKEGTLSKMTMDLNPKGKRSVRKVGKKKKKKWIIQMRPGVKERQEMNIN